MNKKEFMEKFKVGDRIASKELRSSKYLKITYLSRTLFVADYDDGDEGSWVYDHADWKPYEEPEQDREETTTDRLNAYSSAITNINKRLESLEETRGKLSKTEAWKINERIHKLECRIEAVNDYFMGFGKKGKEVLG